MGGPTMEREQVDKKYTGRRPATIGMAAGSPLGILAVWGLSLVAPDMPPEVSYAAAATVGSLVTGLVSWFSKTYS